jgi:hypothetical protein
MIQIGKFGVEYRSHTFWGKKRAIAPATMIGIGSLVSSVGLAAIELGNAILEFRKYVSSILNADHILLGGKNAQ